MTYYNFYYKYYLHGCDNFTKDCQAFNFIQTVVNFMTHL